MKQQKYQSSVKDEPVFAKTERRRDRTGKKKQTHRHFQQEEGEGRARKKQKVTESYDQYSDDWNDEDDILFQWRRTGDIDSVSLKDQNSEDVMIEYGSETDGVLDPDEEDDII